MSCHANLKITALQVDRFAAFFRANQHTRLEHTPLGYAYGSYLPYSGKRGRSKHSAYHGYDNAWDDDWSLDYTTKTKDGGTREHYKRRGKNKDGSVTVHIPAKKTKYSGEWINGEWRDVESADRNNHDPNSTIEPDALPFADSINEIDPIELDWDYVAPLYESARMRIRELYGIDIDELSWHDYCGILGISPTASHSWSDSDWIVWNVIGGGNSESSLLDDTPW
jgi:hypothetical protein